MPVIIPFTGEIAPVAPKIANRTPGKNQNLYTVLRLNKPHPIPCQKDKNITDFTVRNFNTGLYALNES